MSRKVRADGLVCRGGASGDLKSEGLLEPWE
jgi:hypothetical protein